MNNKNLLIACVTGIVITVLGVGAFVIAMGYDTDKGLGWIGTQIGPAILTLVTLLAVKRVKDDTAFVRKRHNGVLDQVFDRLREVEQRTGVAPPVPPSDARPAVTRIDRRPSDDPG